MNILKYSAVLGTTLLLPISAFAASLTLNPANVAPKVGQTFSVNITADPSGAKTYTTRANISFDQASVEFVSFSFAPKWIALSQAGYDKEDNAGGVLIKTAGYPGGVTSATVFGTATFRAKSAGASTISVTNSSLALDAGGKNLISGTQGSTKVTVATPPVQKPAVQTTPVPTQQKTVTEMPASTTTAATTTAEATSTTTSTVGGVAAVGATGLSFKNPVAVLIGILLLAIIGGLIWRYRRTTE